ncbi:MAG: hypothetical protein H6712_12095 [Myxococcales bacterium]|nr:hypothetical protein [Myxococcales bacterium]MCB9714597.1 hypothetical protein [Myxococcales bacterium]
MGAVLLAGCELVDEAEVEVLGEPVAQAVSLEVAEAELREAAPEPLLLTRTVGEVVQEARSEAEARPVPIAPSRELEGERFATPGPVEEPEAFVPYDDGTGTLASAPPSLVRPKVRARPRPRPRAELHATIDEPCDPGLGPVTTKSSGWQCPACGRG